MLESIVQHVVQCSVYFGVLTFLFFFFLAKSLYGHSAVVVVRGGVVCFVLRAL